MIRSRLNLVLLSGLLAWSASGAIEQATAQDAGQPPPQRPAQAVAQGAAQAAGQVPPPAAPQVVALDKRQNTPGEFDHYVLALSWSPSFCDVSAQRAARRGNSEESKRPRATDQQCGERSYAFVVHGLWPQYDKGFPEYCQVPAPRLNRETIGSMLDIMPGTRLVFREWDRHGTCSGLTPGAYFETIRKARSVVKIPDEYLEVKEILTVSPADVEAAFVKANPGLTSDAIAVDCDSRRLRGVRVCLSKELGFRTCPEVDRRTCRRERLMMPPVRGS
jgi:ribonuclease T2